MNMNKMSNRSARRLTGVHPLLVACVCIAMRCAAQDFGVAADAFRTLEEQKAFVRQGKSKTLDSLHREQDDGFSHAVDLYPSGYKTIDEIPQKAWEEVAANMDKAAALIGIELEHGLAWGWDKPHHQIKRIL